MDQRAALPHHGARFGDEAEPPGLTGREQSLLRTFDAFDAPVLAGPFGRLDEILPRVGAEMRAFWEALHGCSSHINVCGEVFQGISSGQLLAAALHHREASSTVAVQN